MTDIHIRLDGASRIAGRETLYLSFAYDPGIVSSIKSLSKRWYHPDTREWEVQLEDYKQVKKTLSSATFTFKNTSEKEILEKIKSYAQPQVAAQPVDLASFTFKTTPYKYQMEGIEFGLNHPAFLLGDEQGLGKTKQALDLALLRKEEVKHCLIICGINGLKYNWLEEIETHTNEKAKIIGSKINTKGRLVEGTVKERLEDLKKLPEAFFLITNIETLRQDSIRDELAKWINFKQIGMVIIDEAHAVKNGQSKQGKAIRYLRAPYKVAMTGTPLINKPLDLYNIMNWLGAITYDQEPFPVFRSKYCIMDDWGSVIGYKNKGELASRLDKIMIRRKKSEVLDLPPKVSVTNYVEISGAQDKLYRQTQQGILKRINRTGLLEQEELTELRNTLEQINYLRKIATFPSSNDPSITANPKIDRLKEILEEKIESGEKVIVYSHWKDVVEALTRELSEYNPCVITGDVSTSKRQEEVRKFQNDPSHKVIIGTIDAMGTGFTLTSAQTVIFMDNPWTAAKKAQAEDRAHRIGTKGNVTIVTLIAKNTIDEKIAHLLKEKEQLAKDIVDSEADEGLIGKMDKAKLTWLFS